MAAGDGPQVKFLARVLAQQANTGLSLYSQQNARVDAPHMQNARRE